MKRSANRKPRAPRHARSAPSKHPSGRDRVIEGTFCGTRRGFGFVTPQDGGEDIFIPASHTGNAFHGDTVRVRYRQSYNGKTEGKIEAVLEKKMQTVIGTLISERVRGSRSSKRRYFLVPDEKGLPEFLPLDQAPDCPDGDKIECRLVRTAYPYAVFLRSFGSCLSLDANLASVLAENGVTEEFEPDVLREAASRAALPLSEEGRERVTAPVLTIDSADAKDLDDAVSLSKIPEGYLLSVHIADVSEYITPKTALDRAAMHRGTSIYFANRVIPMLPKALSNGACSLGAGEDKYALSAHVTLSKDGRILKTRIARSILRSDVRGVYSEVNALFEEQERSPFYEKYARVFPMLQDMRTLYEILEKNARARGYLDFEAPEPYFIMDEKGGVAEIRCRARGISEKMIEQFMLTANEAVASLLFAKGFPCVYRIHEEPPENKLTEFKRYLGSLGISAKPLNKDNVRALDFAEVLHEAREAGKEAAVSMPMLRTMAKASYSENAHFHFGLGIDFYCHFTSPIRRLSDLATHRMIKAVLLDGTPPERYAAYARRAAAAASETELRAMSTERAMTALYTALWAQDHVGEEFEATVSGITTFGMFATLDNAAEGLIPMEELPFGTAFDEEMNTMTVAHEKFRVADRVRICIADASLASRRIRFAFLGGIPKKPE